jgi:hypothetical protein
MRREGDRSGFLIRCVYAACLLVATGTHAVPLIQHGVFWDYGGVGWVTSVFWTSLAVVDPVAAGCLFASPRVGLVLTCGIIGLDVIQNAIVFRDLLLHPSSGHLWTYEAFGLQVAFLLFVIATIRIPWSQTRSDGAPPTAA